MYKKILKKIEEYKRVDSVVDKCFLFSGLNEFVYFLMREDKITFEQFNELNWLIKKNVREFVNILKSL